MFTLELFNSLTTYYEGYNVVNSEKLPQEVIDLIAFAEISESKQYKDRYSVALHLKGGGVKYLGLSITSSLKIGDPVDLTSGVVLELKRKGDPKSIFKFLEEQ